MGRPLRFAFVLVAVSACTSSAFVPRELGPVAIADTPPPPIRGGGLLVLGDGTLLVSDADRDRVLLVDLDARRVRAEVQFEAGSEPGRAVQSVPDGYVYVVLHGAGTVVAVDPRSAIVAANRRHVCPMPSGIGFDLATGIVRVACTSGELVTFSTGDLGSPSRSVFVERDLRDVLVVGDRVFVTTFRAAQLLEVDGNTGAVLSRTRPRDAMYVDASGTEQPFRASVAWRTITAAPGVGPLIMLHQRMRTSSIAVRVPEVDGRVAVDAGTSRLAAAYGEQEPPLLDAGSPSASAVPGCGAIVRSTITVFDLVTTGVVPLLTTRVVPSSGTSAIADARLAVDLAPALGGSEIAVASAGARTDARGIEVVSARYDTGLDAPGGCAPSTTGNSDARAPVAVVADPEGGWIALEREPAALVYRGARMLLGGRSVFDTGHALFHATTSARIACASCHPEGREDGQVWTFDGEPRRTQSLVGGALATAPFHWAGDEPAIRDVMDDVFTHRMSGASLDDEHVAALSAWIDQLPAPRGAVVDPAAVAHGRALFEDYAGCRACHLGSHLTDNLNHDVGHGSVQTPSLVGVSFRVPVMHTGCATTLAGRFDARCGGAQHGNASTLTDTEAADLVAYLDSL